MNLRVLLSTMAAGLSLLAPAAQAVTCAAGLQPSNPDAAYTPQADGTVTHQPSGLIWKRCSEGQSWNGSTCTGSATVHTWAQALALAGNSSFAGQSDWRLPNIKELSSLVEECRFAPRINDTIFPATPITDFWSGSPYAYYSDDAWFVSSFYGYTYYYSRGLSSAVRLVRGGQSFGAFDALNPGAAVGTLITRYRLYSDGTKEHLYTTDANEYSVLPTGGGWLAEGAVYRIFQGAGSLTGVDVVPYYRLYNPASFQHHWTTDLNEYTVLATMGWTQEGVDGYILPTSVAGTLPLYRLYLNALGGLHLWTTDANEKNVLTTTAGWVDEGVAGYVVPLQ